VPHAAWDGPQNTVCRPSRSDTDRVQYPHLRARAVADHVLIETGPLNDPIARIRLRKLSADEWRVELKPDSRWEKTHIQGPRGNMTAAVQQMLQWTLEKKR